MSIKCGHCKGRHDSITEVRECAHGQGVRTTTALTDSIPPSDRRSPIPEVSAGRYAVELDGKLGFFKVDRPTDGRWAGYTFVKQFASDEKHPVRGMRMARVLTAIQSAGEVEAMLRFGREIGACGHCGRTLTDEDSRARGIGPKCAQKMGW